LDFIKGQARARASSFKLTPVPTAQLDKIEVNYNKMVRLGRRWTAEWLQEWHFTTGCYESPFQLF